MAELLYKKEFCLTPTGGLFLKNPDIATAYVETKLAALLNTKDNNIAQRDIKKTIFSDFKKIYEYDCDHAVLPKPYGKFISEDDKKHFIHIQLLYQDFQIYLGDIFANYHENLAKETKIKSVDTYPFVIDYDELYDTAIAEYIRVLLQINHPINIRKTDISSLEYKAFTYRGVEMMTPTGRQQRIVHACAATFILPSFIEHHLLIHLENTVIDKWINGMAGKPLDSEENKLYLKFLGMKKNGYGYVSGDKNQTMEQIWNMGIKYGALPNDPSMKEILCGKSSNVFNTLGTILKSVYGRSKIRPEYLYILDCMFDKKMLNLRNSIAHGVSTNYDYLSIAFVAIMVQIIWDIANGDMFLI